MRCSSHLTQNFFLSEGDRPSVEVSGRGEAVNKIIKATSQEDWVRHWTLPGTYRLCACCTALLLACALSTSTNKSPRVRRNRLNF